jgi:uncharacterized repeat protein (TIGR01451 family)
MTNSTIFNNTAGANGGGIYARMNAGQLTIRHATIVQNTAGTSGGNIDATGPGSISLENSIVGGGRAGTLASNCTIAAASVDAGNNLFFDTPYVAGSTDNCFTGVLASTDIAAGDARLLNGPGLAQSGDGSLNLAPNGGPTPTLALSAGSPALNAANAAACSAPAPGAAGVDQRGFTRFPGGIATCDIGAEEPEAVLTLMGGARPASGTVGHPLTFTYTITNTGPSTATLTTLTGSLPGGVLDGLAPSQGSCSFFGALNCDLGAVSNTRTAALTTTMTPQAPGVYSMTATAADAESGETQPVTVSAPVTGTALAGTAPTGAQSAGSQKKPGPAASSQSKCGSRRQITIHVQHVARFHIVSARIFVSGKARAIVKRPRLTARINLSKQPTGKFTVKIVALEQNGHTLVGRRVYHTCRTRLKGHKFLLL